MIGTYLHHSSDEMLGQVLTNMVEMARDVVVIMARVMLDHHPTTINDVTGMGPGEIMLVRHHLPERWHAVMDRCMVVINFIVVMVLVEVEDDARKAVIHAIQEIVSDEKSINKLE